jgi:hypothetical protein
MLKGNYFSTIQKLEELFRIQLLTFLIAAIELFLIDVYFLFTVISTNYEFILILPLRIDHEICIYPNQSEVSNFPFKFIRNLVFFINSHLPHILIGYCPFKK